MSMRGVTGVIRKGVKGEGIGTDIRFRVDGKEENWKTSLHMRKPESLE